jgi:hypothetical protein
VDGLRAVVCVDGFIADAGDNVGPLFEWYFSGDAEIVDRAPNHLKGATIAINVP